MVSENYVEEKCKYSETKNYKIKKIKDLPKKDIKKDKKGNPIYKTKQVTDRDGNKHILTLAVKNKKGKRGGTTELIRKMEEK